MIVIATLWGEFDSTRLLVYKGDPSTSFSQFATSQQVFKMNFIAIIFAIISALLIVAAVNAAPSEHSCPDQCGDDFDEVVCASNGEELRNFMGRCRLRQYNECHNDCKITWDIFLKRKLIILFKYVHRFRRSWLFRMQAKLNLNLETGNFLIFFISFLNNSWRF